MHQGALSGNFPNLFKNNYAGWNIEVTSGFHCYLGWGGGGGGVACVGLQAFPSLVYPVCFIQLTKNRGVVLGMLQVRVEEAAALY